MDLCKILGVDSAHLIQRIKPYQEDKIKFPCIVQEKFDGVYCIALFDGQRVVGIFSATGKEYLSLDHLKPELKLLKKESGVDAAFIIFEAYADNVSQPTISGWCRDTQEQHPEIYGIVHDVLTICEYLGIIETPYIERAKRISSLNAKHLVRPVSTEVQETREIWELASEIWQRGGEGVIIKNPNAPYSKGKRNWDLIKLKQSVSHDLRVLGVEEGQGKYQGMLGKLVLQWKNGETISVGTGLTDAQRKEWWEHRDRIINKIVQIDAMKESTGGILREPSFKGIRYDKSESDF